MIFVVTDPRGYEIRLTNRCWYNHILIEHPEMKNHLYNVKRAIELPDYIYQSKYRSSSHLYFLEVEHNTLESKYSLVVVDIRQQKNKGYIQTAFLVDGLSKRGNLLWKNP